MMTVMLMVPNPQKIRLALNAHREQAEFPFQETLITSLDQPSTTVELPSIKLDQVDEAPTESRRESRRRSRSTSTQTTDTAPVRVASADPTASIGYQPPPTTPRVSAPPVPDFSSKPAAEATPKVAAQPVPAAEEAPAMKQLDIPVPEPHEPKAMRVAEAPVSKSAPERQPASEQKHEPAESKPVAMSVLEPLARVQQPEQPSAVSVFPGSAVQHGESGHSMQMIELSNDATMSITAGAIPKRWNFRFQEAPLANVFKVLGQYQGYTVVVDDGVSGIYSGQFLEADPAQAFAVLVKSRNYRVSRRGNMILLTSSAQGTLR